MNRNLCTGFMITLSAYEFGTHYLAGAFLGRNNHYHGDLPRAYVQVSQLAVYVHDMVYRRTFDF